MDSLEALVRHVDEDRWLASRFASAQARPRLIALYALNHEIARTAEAVSEPALGDIRLQWWRTEFQTIAQGYAPSALPALQAWNRTRNALTSPYAFDSILDARARDLDPIPFADVAALDAYVRKTAGSMIWLALQACGISSNSEAEEFIAAAGRAWGILGVVRAQAHWRARGCEPFPAGEDQASLLMRAEEAHAQARGLARSMAPAAFPAFGYLALAPLYIRALRRGAAAPALLRRQVTMVMAAATGRI